MGKRKLFNVTFTPLPAGANNTNNTVKRTAFVCTGFRWKPSVDWQGKPQ
jgi:hypothetical protein